ncbi:MAG: DUF3841 domain-containing protein [Kordiimonadaceae bacterium]|nr:DUF3841 domain-containing protein [Kordiimonadaceae bacterium]
MKFWTFQTLAAWEFLQQHGYLEARRHHQADGWPFAYEWMREQLSERIGPPREDDVVPLWGFSQWEGILRKRPDLRSLRHHWGGGGEYVRLECDLPESDLLASDHSAWHIALNNGYMHYEETDDEDLSIEWDDYDKQTSCSSDNVKAVVAKSWEKLFDLEALKRPLWHGAAQRTIQVVFWRLPMEAVCDVKQWHVKASA